MSTTITAPIVLAHVVDASETAEILGPENEGRETPIESNTFTELVICQDHWNSIMP